MQLHFFTAIFEDFEVLNGSGILSDARLKEIKDYISRDKFVAPVLKSNKTIVGWLLHEPTGLLFLEKSLDDSAHYVYERCLEGFLTESEVAVLNKRASSVWSAKQEAARFEKATKINGDFDGENEYKGPVYDETTDSYFETLGDYYEYHHDEMEEYLYGMTDEKPPERAKYVWACIQRPIIHLDTDSIIENGLVEIEDSYYELGGVEDLKLAIDKFNNENAKNVYFEINYKICVLLN